MKTRLIYQRESGERLTLNIIIYISHTTIMIKGKQEEPEVVGHEE